MAEVVHSPGWALRLSIHLIVPFHDRDFEETVSGHCLHRNGERPRFLGGNECNLVWILRS